MPLWRRAPIRAAGAAAPAWCGSWRSCLPDRPGDRRPPGCPAARRRDLARPRPAAHRAPAAPVRARRAPRRPLTLLDPSLVIRATLPILAALMPPRRNLVFRVARIHLRADLSLLQYQAELLFLARERQLAIDCLHLPFEPTSLDPAQRPREYLIRVVAAQPRNFQRFEGACGRVIEPFGRVIRNRLEHSTIRWELEILGGDGLEHPRPPRLAGEQKLQERLLGACRQRRSRDRSRRRDALCARGLRASD